MTEIRSVDEQRRIGDLPGMEGKALPIAPLAPLSSIAKAEERVTVPQLRPKPAEPHIMYRVLGAHRRTEELAAKEAALFDAEATQSFAETDRLLAEKQKTLEEEALAAQSRGTWSALSNVAQYVAGAGTVALGVMCGGWPGVCLAISGGVGLGVRAAHDTGLLQIGVKWMSESEEMQKRIAQKIEVGAFLLQMGFGLAGGIGASYINGAEQLGSIVTGTTAALSVGPRVGSAYYEKRLAYIHARMKAIDTQTTVANWKLHHDSKRMNAMVESVQSQTNELQKAIQAFQQPQEG